MPGWIVLAVIAAILLVLVAVVYNRFVALRQQVREAYADIEA